MNAAHQKVLAALAEEYRDDGCCYYTFDGLVARTGLDRKQVRRSCRLLARKGLAKYGRALWTEDGEPFGSGYSVTEKGAEFALQPEERGQ